MQNLEEIFVWYFEQKGVDNVERFLGVNIVNGVNGINIGANTEMNFGDYGVNNLKALFFSTVFNTITGILAFKYLFKYSLVS